MSVRSFDNPSCVPRSENAAWMIIGDRRPTDSVRDLVRLIKGSPRRAWSKGRVGRRGWKEGREEGFGKFWIRIRRERKIGKK